MKKIYTSCLITILSFLLPSLAHGAISVVAGTGGTGICSIKAQTGSSPAFTTLGTITVRESAAGDITPTGSRTLILNAPTGWRFNTGATPTFTFSSGHNILFVTSGGFTATQLTLMVFVNNGTLSLDTFNITGLQVQATTTGAAAGNIYASSATGFTGVTTGAAGTNFGSLSLTAALTPTATITASPGTTICAGTTVTYTSTTTNAGAPTYQWKLNGSAVAGETNSFYFNGSLANGNTVRLVITPTGCVTSPTVNSNLLTMTVNALPNPVTVTGGGNVCTSATLLASNGGSGTIYYEGTTPSGTSTATPSTTQVISTSGTYYFRAQSAAGCWGTEGSATVSINSLPITVTPTTTPTVCLGGSATFTADATPSPVTLLTEDFNSGIGSWTITNLSGTTGSYWQIYSSPGYSGVIPGDGTPSLQTASDATGTATIPTHSIFTSPSFSLAGYSSATLSFNQYYQYYASGDSTVTVEYSIDGGATWVTFIDQLGTTTGTATWTAGIPTTSVTLPAAVNNQPDVMVRWNYNSDWGWYWAIDNIQITGIPTLTYTWTGIAGAAGLSCTSCATTTITPTAAGTNVYSVSTTYLGCPSTPAAGATVSVNPLPTAFALSGGGSSCSGASFPIDLPNSEIGVSYQLYNGATPVGSPIAGTGSAISFGPLSTAGTYSVIATNMTTGCSGPMTGTATIAITPGSTVYTMTGGGMYCAGASGVLVGLDGSDLGVIYQLYDGGSMMGGPVGGTGSALNFGMQTIAGTYTVLATDPSSGCSGPMSGSATVAINPAPSAFNVTGGGTLCAGSAGVDVGIAGSEIGINYQLYDGAMAVGSVMPGTGAPIDFGLQTVAGTYTVLGTNTITGCTGGMTGSAIVTVIPAPAAIAGPGMLCTGNSSTLTNTTVGGTWTSADITVATIDATTGVIIGIMPGTVTISYSTGTGCVVTTVETVNPSPVVAAITGVTNLCVGGTTTLSDLTPGGTWSSSDLSIVMIDPVTGEVLALAPGTVTISYTVTSGGCSTSATTPDTVSAIPTVGTISGSTSVCTGSTTTLSSTPAGGTWMSMDPTIAIVDAVTGVVTGITAGTTTISYTVTSAPGCSGVATITETVGIAPTVAPITGSSSVCGGMTATLSNATMGGTWSSSDVTIATVGSSSGIVTGIAVGTATVSYTLSGAGCSVTTTTNITVGSGAASVTVYPSATAIAICHGHSVHLYTSTAATGLSYQWYLNGVLIPGATGSSYTAATAGVYKVTVDNGSCTWTSTGKTVFVQTTPTINYNTIGHYLYTGSYATLSMVQKRHSRYRCECEYLHANGLWHLYDDRV
jgi:uncharacterized protein YjdB